jgi:hypothetical protein
VGEFRFRIVFEQLERLAAEDREAAQSQVADAELHRELDEIAELRRLVLETTAPEHKSFTTS